MQSNYNSSSTATCYKKTGMHVNGDAYERTFMFCFNWDFNAPLIYFNHKKKEEMILLLTVSKMYVIKIIKIDFNEEK